MSYSDPSQGVEMKQETFISDSYIPAEDEPFMNERQVEYFRRKLLDWKNDLLSDSKETIEGLQDGTRNIPDIADRASEETDRALELRTRDRQRKLVSKIDAALRRIDEGEYGYCDVTGEPISLKRLDARPIATMSLEAKVGEMTQLTLGTILQKENKTINNSSHMAMFFMSSVFFFFKMLENLAYNYIFLLTQTSLFVRFQ
mgnify:CR=1 FL=1